MRLRSLLAMMILAGFALAQLVLFPAPTAAQEKKDEFPPFDEVTKDKEKIPGFVTLWYDEKKHELLAEIPSNLLNSDFLVSTSISSGVYAGLQSGSSLWRIERQDKQALIVVPNVFYTASGELKEVVEYTYPDEVIATVPILTEGAGGSIVIDLKSLLASQAGDYGMTMRTTVTEIRMAKSFPTNSVVELRFRGPNGGWGIYFNLGELPKPGYKPRMADSRIGYFVTAKQDFSTDPREDTIFVRKINRWRLEKVDPSLELSPPKEPIVIYIEDTVPVRYRRWVREGIERWNEAFEEIGFVDAIEVRQQTETNQFKDYDPEDARYNFFRWITSQTPFAVAPSRVDPRTGEVLDSDILFDESMIRYFIREFDIFVNSVPEAMDLSPRMRHWLAMNPHEHPDWQNLALDYSVRIRNNPEYQGMKPEQLFAEELLSDPASGYHHHEHGSLHGHCSIGTEIRRELAFASLGLQYGALAKNDKTDSSKNEAKADEDEDEKEGEEKNGEEKEDEKEEEETRRDLLKDWPEEFIGPIIREIVCHEFGHTLGLRHNFKASSWKTYEEIVNAEDPNEPTVASVMDYNPFTLREDGEVPSLWITPTIGPYDKWAIEYGYAVAGSGDYPKNEEQMLKQILDRVAEPGLDYGTDEDVASPDPLITRWDLGKDPLTYFQTRINLADKIMAELREVAVEDDESWSKARGAYEILLSERLIAAANASKFVGSYHLRRDHKGDPNARPPIEVYDGKTQREAMKMITEVLFAPDAFGIDPELQNYLAASRWYHRGSMDMMEPLTFPIQDTILRYQRTVLFRLTNPERIRYLYDAEFNAKPDQDIYTLPEMIRSLTDSIWAEVQEGKILDKKHEVREPAIPHLRRNLQREYLGRLITIATSDDQSMYPAVSRTLAWKELKDLGTQVDGILENKRSAERLDAYTLAHLEESSARIEKALNAIYTLNGGSGSFPFIFLYGQQSGGTPSDGMRQAPPSTQRAPMLPRRPGY